MGESRAKTGFGQVDLQMDAETDDAFGELDWDFPASEPTVPPSATQSAPAPAQSANTRQTLKRSDEEMAPVVDSTRVVAHSPLSPGVGHDRDKTPVPSSFKSAGSGQHGAPSSSHVASTNDRVALMREAYARGDADGALAIASAMEAATVPPPPSSGLGDHPDSAVDIVVGEEVEIEIDEEEPVHAKDLTRVVAPAGPALSSLTERQGIPRVLLGPQEISKLPIDHRAGFLLGFIDGMQTMEEILDVCAMPQSEALELIRTLVEMGVIRIE